MHHQTTMAEEAGEYTTCPKVIIPPNNSSKSSTLPSTQNQVNDFPSLPQPDIPIGGRLKHFTNQWYKLTKDPEVVSMITGCDIKIHSKLTDVKKHPDIIRSQEEIIFAKKLHTGKFYLTKKQ